MADCLIDTNVLSELRRRDRANPGVLKWFDQENEEGMFISVMSLGEIRKGVERLRPRDPFQAKMLESWLYSLERSFAGKILSITADIADHWGHLQAIRPLPEVDALLAATARGHNLALITRNEHDFSALGITIVNPFSMVSPES